MNRGNPKRLAPSLPTGAKSSGDPLESQTHMSGMSGPASLTPHMAADIVSENKHQNRQMVLPKELENLDIESMPQKFKKLAAEAVEKDRKVQELTDQLATLMNKEMSVDETNVESISTAFRPMKLAEDYKNFCSTSWISAKNALDRKTQASEKDKCELLNCALQYSYEEIQSWLQRLKHKGVRALVDVLHGSSESMTHGRQATTSGYREETPAEKRLLHDIDYGISNYLKAKPPTHLFEKEKENIIRRLTQNNQTFHSHHQMLHRSARLSSYIHESCQLSWPMLIQRPPMTFDMSSAYGKPYNHQEQELAYNSADPSKSGSKVVFYVNPAVYHGEPGNTGKLLVKGKVFVG